MNEIDWKSKLSSRKFWCALAGLVAPILVACNVDEGSIFQISAFISAAVCWQFIFFSEAYVDANRQSDENTKSEG